MGFQLRYYDVEKPKCLNSKRKKFCWKRFLVRCTALGNIKFVIGSFMGDGCARAITTLTLVVLLDSDIGAW